MNARRQSRFMTDIARHHKEIGREFAGHDAVNHGKDQYVRYEAEHMISTNTVEDHYSIFKLGMKGVYQHCGEKHLHRYLAELDFHYSNRVRFGGNDEERTAKVLKGVVGKRLTYRSGVASRYSLRGLMVPSASSRFKMSRIRLAQIVARLLPQYLAPATSFSIISIISG